MKYFLLGFWIGVGILISLAIPVLWSGTVAGLALFVTFMLATAGLCALAGLELSEPVAEADRDAG